MSLCDCVAFCRALSDSTRQEILKLLQQKGDLTVGDIVTSLRHGSQPTISHHLKILKNEGLVNSHRNGKEIIYSINAESVEECCGLLWNKFTPAKTLLKRLPLKAAHSKRT